ncbi:MAG: SGNH/GDSL hydrolase family protein [Actinomycetota bacterium]|nr:SGNH/GDSL hydrolase family protein [Actinomycetota bacterium]
MQRSGRPEPEDVRRRRRAWASGSRLLLAGTVLALAASVLVACLPGGTAVLGLGAESIVTDLPTSLPTDPALPRQVPASRTKIVVLGDSISTGFRTSAQASWPNVMVQDLARAGVGVTVINGAQNGAGYVEPGSADLPFDAQARAAVVPDADVVLVFGSENDRGQDPGRISTKAGETIAVIRDKAPAARILLIGPASYTPVIDPQLAVIRDAIASAAQSAGVTFVDPIQLQWIMGQADTLIGPDADHPTVRGHEYLAAMMSGLVRPLIPRGK